MDMTDESNHTFCSRFIDRAYDMRCIQWLGEGYLMPGRCVMAWGQQRCSLPVIEKINKTQGNKVLDERGCGHALTLGHEAL